MGCDVDIVNAARVSFGKEISVMNSSDIGLLKYLAEHGHESPFRHVMVKFRIKAPEFVMRQAYKHIVGIEGTSNSATKDHAWNEISQRYVPVSDTFIPDTWRSQSDDNKQASDGFIENQNEAHELYHDYLATMAATYQSLLNLGVAKEQARIVLPLAIYSEVIWTASFQAIMNFIRLRDHAHAQQEIRDFAIVIRDIMFELFPEAMHAWTTYHPSFQRPPT